MLATEGRGEGKEEARLNIKGKRQTTDDIQLASATSTRKLVLNQARLEAWKDSTRTEMGRFSCKVGTSLTPNRYGALRTLTDSPMVDADFYVAYEEWWDGRSGLRLG